MFLVLALSALFSLEAQARCFIVVAGSVTLKPGEPVAHARDNAEKAAAETGCTTLTFKDRSPADFEIELKEFALKNGIMKEDSIHLAFADHGVAAQDPENPMMDFLPFEMVHSKTGKYTSGPNYQELASILARSFPKGVHLTYSSSTCFPKFHLFRTLLENTFEICGATSTTPDGKSYNPENGAFIDQGFQAAFQTKSSKRNLWQMYTGRDTIA
ncbi:hypothetical protein WDW86_18970 [Bdellovibrionota bacterium FG-2]